MSGWISAADRLPPSGVPVIACYRNSAGQMRRIRAEYVATHAREQSDDIDDLASEYDEETDTYYWPAGWYELMNNWDDYASIAVHEGEITHWHAMPECPVEDEMLERLEGEPMTDITTLRAAEAPAPMTAAATDVLAERRRQVEAEGWTATHDDQHRSGELAVAAVCYAIYIDGEPPPMWPFDPTWWRPVSDRRNLVKAAALLLAEIERLDRAAAQEPKP